MTSFFRRKKINPKTIRLMTISAVCGIRGLMSSSSAARARRDVIMGEPSVEVSGSGVGRLEDERQGQADDEELLGEDEAQDGDLAQLALSLGLTGDTGDERGEDQADADTGADRGEA